MKRFLALGALPGSLLLATPALAHPGHGTTGIVAGFIHPFTGIDHLLAMVMVGLWSGLAFRRAPLRLPAIFLAGLVAGFLYGVWGGAMAFPELLIQASLALVGLALVLDLRVRAHVAGVLVGVTALAHGFAHGIEVPAGSDPRGFLAGFVAASVLLLALGLGAARLASARGFRRASTAIAPVRSRPD
jgi:urease accessory protein